MTHHEGHEEHEGKSRELFFRTSYYYSLEFARLRQFSEAHRGGTEGAE